MRNLMNLGPEARDGGSTSRSKERYAVSGDRIPPRPPGENPATGDVDWAPRPSAQNGGIDASKVDESLHELCRFLMVERQTRPRLVPLSVFRESLHVERSRADRTGSPLSVILLMSGAGVPPAPDSIDGLLEELRGGDSVCILESGTVSALLPNTGRTGAQVVVGRVHERGSWNASASRIVVYPEDTWSSSAEVDAGSERRPAAPRVDRDLYPIEKRVTDVVLASLVLLVFAPVLILLAGWIKLVSPGPVLFRQERVGLGGRHFEMLKLRTMHQNNRVVEAHREHSTSFIQNDAAMPKAQLPLISGGWLIRGLCFDELPQFLNVLKGDMSIVGPRPCLPYEAEAYKQWHWRRFSIMPGITGLWQVSGKNRLTFNQMVRLDLQYARGVSWRADAMILLRTGPAVAREFLLTAGRRRAT